MPPIRRSDVGQLAALVHAIGGDSAAEMVLKDNALAKRVKRLISDAEKGITRSFAELLLACRQRSIAEDFNAENFPLEPATDDESDWEVCVHRFDFDTNCLATFKKLRKLGYRLCGVRRAMEFFAETHYIPGLCFGVVVTTRGKNAAGHWCLPMFHTEDRLGLFTIEEMDRCCSRGRSTSRSWLVLRKKQAA